jgi:hypothetical protein
LAGAKSLDPEPSADVNLEIEMRAEEQSVPARVLRQNNLHPPEFREQMVALVRAGRSPEELSR